MRLSFKTTKVYHKIRNAYNTFDWNWEQTIDGSRKLVWGRKYKYIVNKGGSRSSKTYSLLQFFAILMLKRKDLKITVWRNEKVTCKATAMEDFKKILLTTDGLFALFEENKTKGYFKCKSTGAVIIFEGGDNDQKVHGMAQHISFFNEASEFSLDVYRQISQRTEETCFFDYNPSKQFWLEPFKNNARAKFMHSTYKDNAFVTPDIIERLEGYLPWHPDDLHIEDKSQRRDHPENVENGTASEFHYVVYCLGLGSEKPNLIHQGWRKMKDDFFKLLPYTSYLGLDFGSAKPTAMVEIKFDGKKTFYINQKCYEPIRDLNTDLCDTIELKISPLDKNEVEIIADPAKKSYINDLNNDGFIVIKARKGNDSIQRGNDKIGEFNVYVTESSEDVFSEQENYTFQKDRYGLVTDKPDPNCEDHLMDAIRYCIDYICRCEGL